MPKLFITIFDREGIPVGYAVKEEPNAPTVDLFTSNHKHLATISSNTTIETALRILEQAKMTYVA